MSSNGLLVGHHFTHDQACIIMATRTFLEHAKLSTLQIYSQIVKHVMEQSSF